MTSIAKTSLFSLFLPELYYIFDAYAREKIRVKKKQKEKAQPQMWLGFLMAVLNLIYISRYAESQKALSRNGFSVLTAQFAFEPNVYYPIK